MKRTLWTVGLLVFCSRAMAVDAQALDFIKGDKPPADAQAYSLHLGGISGVPNGMQKKGRDGNQLYVLKYTEGNYSRGLLQAGDVILGVNGKPFEGDVIDTWREAVADAPRRSADGNLRILRWRSGSTTTLDFLTVLPPPDLTRGETNGVDRTGTYNLGPTGLRGWIYTKAASSLDGLQGRTTTASRQILVTHVGTNSPADGVMAVNDVILGVGGTPFTDDARRSLGRAITEAEKEENKGRLQILRWRAGKTETVELALRVLGAYSDTAPYDCPKSRRILAEACRFLEQETLPDNLWGSVSGLALLATGKPEYLPKVQSFARAMAAGERNRQGGGAWDCGYKNVFLSEYYLLTGDREVLPGIEALTVKLAKGQGMYGTFGHGFSDPAPDGKLHGSIPPYGPVNQAGLVANLGIVLGKKCGVSDPEIDPAIWRASRFFSYFVGKGAIPYGEHIPCPMHENNGKNSIAALLFAIQGRHGAEAKYFASMSTAAYANRECGHTGQGFSYLWSALGANAGGPDAAAAFLKEARWHLDLVRRCDGSFTYDGGEQYGPGRTDDNTYYGRSGYYGLSPAATYVLTYSLPLKKLFITGRGADKANWLSRKDVSAAIASGRFDVDSKTMSPDELLAAFADWSPVVRGWAAAELARRPEAAALTPKLIALAEGASPNVRQGACEALGYIRSTNALPVLIRLLRHEDRWLRVKAASALRNMRDAARPALMDMLQAVVDTAEPVQPIVWADPVQLTHAELAAAIFDGLLRSSIDGVDRKLLYPAIQAVARNASGMARSYLADTFTSNLTAEDVRQLAPDILNAIRERSPADTMFGNDLRMAGARLLAKYRFREGIRAIVDYAKIIDGHGSQVRVPILMEQLATYGAAARDVVPELRLLIDQYNAQCRNGHFPADCNKLRIESVEKAIRSIEAATEEPELRSLTPGNARHPPAKVFILAGQSNVEGQAVADLDGEWSHSGTLYVLTTPEGANLPAAASERDVPVLVRLHKDWFPFGQAKADGADLRFASDAGTPLPYQIEEWDASNGTASVWVKLPAIRGNAKQAVKVYWGRPDAASESSGTSVFNASNGFVSVLHMTEPLRDEVGTVTLRDDGTAATGGMVGPARKLGEKRGIWGGDDITNYPSGAGPMTTEAWFKAEKPNSTVLAWGKEKRPGKVMMNFLSPPRIAIQCYFADVEAQTPLAMDEWYHVVHTYSKNDSRVYVNGRLDGTSTPLLDIPATSCLWIGGWYRNYSFAGTIDEVRISRVARSADWVALQYENQKPLQTLVGHLVQPGSELSLSSKSIDLAEGESAVLTARAGGAQKLYWIVKENGAERVAGADTFRFTLHAGRVDGDRSLTLCLKAVYPDGVKTLEIPARIREDIPDPSFTLKAPGRWDGREAIAVVPEITNERAMKAKQAGALTFQWAVSGIAAGKSVEPGRLVLHRAQNSGPLTVTATADNGGTPVSRSIRIDVKEPPRDAWVPRPAGKDEKPADHQLYARDDRNEGTLYYNGTLSNAADAVFLKVYADDRMYETRKQALKESREYAFAVKLKPGLVKYKVEFGTSDGGVETVLHTATNIVCGDAYLIDGQSNAVSTDWGPGEHTDTSEWVRSFGSMNGDVSRGWGIAVRRRGAWEIGYWGMDLARRLVESEKIPICIMNGAAGGTLIEAHQCNPTNRTDSGTIYGRLLNRVQLAGLTHGIRGVFWHQGENNQGTQGATGRYGWETYEQYFVDMSAAWKQDYPNILHHYVFQIWPDSCSMGHTRHSDKLRDVQRTLPRLFSNMSAMSTLGIKPPGGCHFPPAGYAELARLIAPLVQRDNYGKTFAEPITPPDLRRARFTTAQRDEIALEFDQPVAWSDSLVSQFYLDQEESGVAAGSVSGNTITLKLKEPSAARAITYLRDRKWSADNLLYGRNGIAALTFCDVDVEAAAEK